MRFVLTCYSVTGRFGVEEGDSQNTYERTVIANSEEELRTKMGDIQRNWVNISKIELVNPENPSWRKTVEVGSIKWESKLNRRPEA